ncbi:hypothetical protein JJB07_16825 [Tumebacillus sp. ITR2]|uniref:Uncharacterized protein n=1 Tax=Tumebacillus amylolyticus TaxID=2801339 RepID=A0ABS1JDH4_9BACL|nr:hypothetical protein [Tumebacillus amylolyticus]MBL0388275.1 hypothetical protein [Tumebacillus amylolyticus]
MPVRINRTNTNIAITRQALSQNGIAIGGNLRQQANQIAITRQSNNNSIRILDDNIFDNNGRGRRRRNRRVDIVTITFRRTLNRGRRITSVTIIGNARQCDRFLQIGARVAPAANCLRNAGFVLIRSRGNVLVFIRIRRG